MDCSMALSYLHGTHIYAGFLINQQLSMMQDAEQQQPFNNNVALYPEAMSRSMARLSALNQDFLATQALMKAGLSPALHSLATSSLFNQNLFDPRDWRRQSRSPPPSSVHLSPVVSPALSTSSNSTSQRLSITAASGSINDDDDDNNHNNNNNNVPGSKKNSRKKRKPTQNQPLNTEPIVEQQSTLQGVAELNIEPSATPALNSETGSPAISPEIEKKNKKQNFVCNVCQRGFGYKHVLQNHERTHTGEKPFQCPVCNKRFTRDHHLKTHMRLHTGEKPYCCKYCQRRFVQVANLRRHVRVHTGERPYLCRHCNNRFSDSNQLKAHVMVHNGEKPYECDNCHGRFRRRHHLHQHRCNGDNNGGDDAQDFEAELDENDDIDIDGEQQEEPESIPHSAQERVLLSRSTHRPLPSPIVDIAAQMLNLPGPSNAQPPGPSIVLPEQTEPEDLSMSTTRRHYSSNSSNDSSLSRSLSKDSSPEQEDEKYEASLFLRHTRAMSKRQPRSNP